MRARPLLLAAVVALVATAAPVQLAAAAPSRPGQLVVVAGLGPSGYSGDGGPAREARITAERISVGGDGSVYLSEPERVRRVTPDGVITTVFVAEAGAGGVDREIVTAAAAAPGGALYLTVEADYERQLRRIDGGGRVTVLAGEDELGVATLHGDGDDVAVDGAGNAYLYDATNRRVVRVDPAGAVTAVGDTPVDLAGARLAVGADGTVFLTEDDETSGRGGGSLYALGATGPPRQVAGTEERPPTGPAVAPDGSVYFIDQSREQIMVVGGDGVAVPVSQALRGLNRGDLAVGPDGDLYVTSVESSPDNHQVLRLVRHGEPTAVQPAQPARPARSVWADDRPGTVHTVAGSGARPPSRKDQRAADFLAVGGTAVGGDGTVYVSEPARNQVLAVAPDGAVRRFAGTGAGGDTDGRHEGAQADEVVLNRPFGVATAPDGSVYVCANGSLYRVDPDGRIGRIDTGKRSGEPTLDAPRLVAVDPAGTVYFADYQSINRIGSDGVPVLVVGHADEPVGGDVVPAHETLVHDPRWFAVGSDGSVYYIETDSDAVKVARPDGTLDVLAGGRVAGFAGDGGPAAGAALNKPSGVAVGRDGARYVADTYNNRVRRVDANGVIGTVAGTGQRGDTGDGGPATAAAITDPTGVAVGEDGTLHVVTAAGLVRTVDRDGAVRTVADLHPAPSRRATDVPFSSLDSFAVGVDGTIHLISATGLYSTRPNGELRPFALDPPLPTYARYGPSSPIDGGPLAAGRDGSLYLVPNALLRAHPDGSVVTLLGGGMSNRMADQPPEKWVSPTEYTFREGDPRDIAVAEDGTVYLSTTHGLYSVGPDGAVDVVLKAGDHDLFGGVALDQDGRPHVVRGLAGVDRVVDGRTEPVVRKAFEQQRQRPEFDAVLEDPADVAFTSDGVMFVSAGREIRRFSPNGDIATVHRSADSVVTQLVTGPGGDLYFLQPDTNQVRVLVRAAAAPPLPDAGPSSSATLGWVVFGAIVVVVGGGAFLSGRRNRRKIHTGRSRSTDDVTTSGDDQS